MSGHRARVVAAVERHLARRSPAGFFPVNALAPWVTMAGSGLHCAHCGAEARAPLPRAPGYGEAVERFLSLHRDCADPEGRVMGGRASERRQTVLDSGDGTTGGRTVSTPLRLLEQASAFLMEVAHERGLWPAVLHRWAERRGLSPEEAEDLRRVILRQRVQEAMAHHHRLARP